MPSKSRFWSYSKKTGLLSNVQFFTKTSVRADVLTSFCSDNSPVIFTFAFELNNKVRKGLWKFNKSLLPNDEYNNKLKNHTSESLHILDHHCLRDDQITCEYIKYAIR